MKSAFGSKRKARKIQVDEDDERGGNDAGASAEAVNTSNPGPTTSNPGRKAFKKSTLRQSIAFDDISQDVNDFGSDDTEVINSSAQSSNKLRIARSSSLTKKKRSTASRLSFGPGEIISGDVAEALQDDEAFTPKKTNLGRRVIESNALRKSLPYQSLPARATDEDEERPTYSEDYLKELKSSTPSTPKDLKVHASVEDVEGLDALELEGAVVVQTKDIFGSSTTFIPSEAEIREKKERRARLAREKDFISLHDDDPQSQLSLLLRKGKPESRLVREDEDLGEGFDEFVDDGRISLGKKQEREAKRRYRKEMAGMIQQAEGSSDEHTDDSEAERRAAYEAAQTRAGMDGLHKPGDDMEAAAVQVPAKITPLPALAECLERLQTTISEMEQDLAQRHKNLADLEQEKRDILARELDVQELLKEAGARYSVLKAESLGAVTDPQSFVEAHNGSVDRMVDRGLESFGNTPTTRTEVEDNK